jgi:hypothetical protein
VKNKQPLATLVPAPTVQFVDVTSLGPKKGWAGRIRRAGRDLGLMYEVTDGSFDGGGATSPSPSIVGTSKQSIKQAHIQTEV